MKTLTRWLARLALPSLLGLPATGGATNAKQEACVDAWLNQRGLDEYGHRAGTQYAGGTPLLDERSGRRSDRLEYLFRRHPELRKACPPGASRPRK